MDHARALRRLGALAVTAVLATSLAACAPEPADGEARRDPAPSFTEARTTQVDETGASWTAGAARIEVPADAVRVSVANVTVGADIGAADSGIAREVFGTPVRVETPTSLQAPMTVTWDTGELPPEAASAAALVRWDGRNRVWVPDDAPLTVAEGTLTAELAEAGVVTWATTALSPDPAPVQTPADPECRDDRPAWTAVATDPDRERDEAALAVCAEAQSDVLTVRTVDRGDVPRALALQGEAAFAWVTRDGVIPRFWQIAADVVDDERTVLLAPGAGADVGLDPGDYAASAPVDERMAALDLLSRFADRVSLGEVADPSVTALVRTLLSCGAPHSRALGDADDVAALGARLTECAAQLADPASELSAAFADEAGPDDGAGSPQGERAVRAAIRIAAAGAFDALAAARSEALVAAATAPLGGASWTVLAEGESAALGSWTPTCTDVPADSAALFANLARRPEFSDPALRLAAHAGWREATVAAVAPMAACTPEQRSAFAARLPDLWASAEAAAVAVDSLSGLGLSLLSCTDLLELAAPIAEGFHPLGGVTASGTGRVACGWADEPGKSVGDETKARVQVWVSRENADAEEIARRRAEAGRTELGGLQESKTLDAVGGFAVGAYVPAGLELESWLPGYRIVVTTTSDDDPTQWRLPAGVAAVERIADALASR